MARPSANSNLSDSVHSMRHRIPAAFMKVRRRLGPWLAFGTSLSCAQVLGIREAVCEGEACDAPTVTTPDGREAELDAAPPLEKPSGDASALTSGTPGTAGSSASQASESSASEPTPPSCASYCALMEEGLQRERAASVLHEPAKLHHLL